MSISSARSQESQDLPVFGTEHPVTITKPEAIQKGRESYDKLRQGNGTQSGWSWRESIYLEGWKKSRHTDAPYEYYSHVYKDPNIPRDVSLNCRLALDQTLNFYNSQGDYCEPTSAWSHGTYNLRGKTIVSSSNFSPGYMLCIRFGVDELDDEQEQYLPQLKYWSDLVWVAWTSISQSTNELAALKYVFKKEVITPNTVFIIESVLGLERGNFPTDGGKWPGTIFTPEKEEFFALLGTAHGKGIANLLNDHPNQFSDKSVESITVFTTGDGNDMK